MFEIDVAIGVENCLRHYVVVFCHADALQMDDLYAAIIDDPQAGFRHPNTQIEIIAVHEELLVEYTDLFEHASRSHHEGTVDGTDIVGSVGGKIRQVVSRKNTPAWKARRETAAPAKAVP